MYLLSGGEDDANIPPQFVRQEQKKEEKKEEEKEKEVSQREEGAIIRTGTISVRLWRRAPRHGGTWRWGAGGGKRGFETSPSLSITFFF